ncbi:unnamed protein product [Linum tenue]|uniref:Uncharacterized protein n=1 Tax=Linum tenue TaxID=586396 RepID=A0AAV0RS34_9ROSI|nr:unnamed protein product [Linum tenue]
MEMAKTLKEVKGQLSSTCMSISGFDYDLGKLWVLKSLIFVSFWVLFSIEGRENEVAAKELPAMDAAAAVLGTTGVEGFRLIFWFLLLRGRERGKRTEEEVRSPPASTGGVADG